MLVLVSPTLLGQAGERRNSEEKEKRRQEKVLLEEQQSNALLDSKTLEKLSLEIGLAPNQCQSVGDLSVVCSWELYNRMPSYKVLAGILSTTKVVYIVCTLPKDGSPRSPNSCSLQAVDADQIVR
jgi:hypothetical protein